MRKLVVLTVLGLTAMACGPTLEGPDDGDRPRPTRVDAPPPSLPPVPWTIDNPPLPKPPFDRNVEVVVADPQVSQGSDSNSWEYVLDGQLLRIWSSYPSGNLERITASMDIDFSTEPPSVTGGAITYSSSVNQATQWVERGTLQLRSADLEGVVAGTWQGPYPDTVTFSVDLGSDSTNPIVQGEPFRLGLGEIATTATGAAITFRQVIEDSRCPPDVTCVWAGEAIVELEVVQADQRGGIVLQGFATEAGPVYGEQPSAELLDGAVLSMIGLEEGPIVVLVVAEG